MASKTQRTCSVARLASLFNITTRRVQQLVDEKIVVLISRGKYDEDASIMAYTAFLQKLAGAGGSDELEKERTLLTREKRKQAEIATALLEGSVVNAELADAFWAEYQANAKAKLLSIATTFAGQFASETDPNIIKASIDQAIRDGLTELAAWNPDIVVKKFIRDKGKELRAAADADGEPVGGQES